MRSLVSTFAVVVALILPAATSAMTIIPPVNLAELAKDSDAVVVAHAVAANVVGAEFFATRTTFVIDDALSGSAHIGDAIEVEVPGGELGEMICAVPGSPRFEAGATYFLCLVRLNATTWVPRMASYGVLKQEFTTKGVPVFTPLREARFNTIARPDGRAVEPVLTYAASALTPHLRDCLSGRARWDSRVAAVADTSVLLGVQPAGCNYFFINAGGVNYSLRWFEFDEGGSISMLADQSNDAQVNAISIVPAALATWNSPSLPNASINIAYGGTVPVTPNCGSADPFTMQGKARHTIVFNDPCHAIPDLTPAGGVLAQGGTMVGLNGGNAIASAYAGDDCKLWLHVEDWFLLVNNNIVSAFGISNLATYQLVLAHEIGHGLGFDHVADANALMNGTCCHSLNATDVACAQYSYARLTPRISTSSPNIDFGSVLAGTSKSQVLNIRSVGTANLSVTGFSITGTAAAAFSVIAPSSALVSPCVANPSFDIQVKYTPGGRGLQVADLIITNNDPAQPSLDIPLLGTGLAPRIQVDPNAVAFGEARVGTDNGRTVAIRNTGTANLSVTSATLQFGNRGFGLNGGFTTTMTVLPGQELAVQVTFSPQTAGARTDTLVVRSNDSSQLTVNVPISGTGTKGMLTVTPPSLDFGEVNAGSSKTLSLTVKNTGNAFLGINSIALTAATGPEFTYSGPTGGALNPNESMALDVKYTPSGGGQDTGGLLIDSIDPDHPQTIVPLSGSGLQGGTLEVTPPGLDFGDVLAGTSKPLSVTVKNTGQTSLGLTGIALTAATGPEFTYTGPPSGVLNPNGMMTLNLKYSPSGVGTDTGGLRIASDDPAHPQKVVQLSGNGTALPGGTQIPGDCNSDGVVDISDPICLLGFLFLGQPTSLPCGTAGPPEPDGPAGQADIALMDWNGDGGLDLSDVVATLNSLFAGKAPHVLDVLGTGRSCVRILGCPNVCTP